MKKVQKKSQMKTFESVAVLIIFFILIGLGLIFYGGVQRTAIKQTYAERVELEAIKMAMKVSFLPEALCSKRKIVEDDCFDVYKLESISKSIQNDESYFLYYQRDFRESVISVKQVFPVISGDIKTYVIYNNEPDPEDLRNYYIIPTYTPVSLKNSSMAKEYSMGLLNVTMFIPKI